jgi:hypothetical protein
MHTTKSLKDKKKNHIIFYTENTKIQKYVLACILALITSLLELWELGQYFQNFKKIFCFLLISGIMNLYVKRIPDIKKVVSFI